MTREAQSLQLTIADEPSDLVKSEQEIRQPIPDPTAIASPPLSEIIMALKAKQAEKWEKERKRIGFRASNYYFGRLQLQELETAMKIEFPETWQKKRKQAENMVRSVATQLSVIYKTSTRRTARFTPMSGKMNIDDAGISQIIKDQSELIDFVYKKGKINKALKEVERFAKWARSVAIFVNYDQVRQAVEIRPYAPQFWDAMVDENGNLRAMIISNFVDGDTETDDETETRKYWVYTSQFRTILQGASFKQVGEMIPNPIGMIPFILFNDDEPFESEKPYLMADNLLVNTNLNINLLLSDSLSLSKFQTYGQPWISGVDEEDLPITSGHEELWLLKQSASADSVDIGILQPTGDFAGLRSIMERIANGYATTRGLPANAFSVEKTVEQSGVALKIKNSALIETRDSEEEKYQCLEFDIFNILRAWHNRFANAEGIGGHNLPEIREDIWLSAAFPRNEEVFESSSEVQRTALTEVSQGLLKPSDFLRNGRFKGMDEKEAELYLKQVKEQKAALGMNASVSQLDQAIGIEEGGDREGAPDDVS